MCRSDLSRENFHWPARQTRGRICIRWTWLVYEVKQGCVLAQILFNLFFTCVLSHAVRDIEDGVYIRYRIDGSLFGLRRLSAKTKTIKKLILEALFADDCALMAHTESALQLIVNKFAEASCLFGLTISLGKTEVLFQPSPLTPGRHPSISIEETELKTGGIQVSRQCHFQ
ncbi:hypothetical protein ACOMHN_050387 [Nucella lapillus]